MSDLQHEHIYSTPVSRNLRKNSILWQHTEKVTVVKGPLGFGFVLDECDAGHYVREIIDHPRCFRLQEGDILLEVNEEQVTGYSPLHLCHKIEKCVIGAKATFLVHRKPQTNQSSSHDTQERQPASKMSLETTSSEDECFAALQIHLVRQTSGFGFRIIGGAKTALSQATVGSVQTGHAADGKLKVGDEIMLINGKSVNQAYHSEVIDLMKKAAEDKKVVLTVRRKMHQSDMVSPGSHDDSSDQVTMPEKHQQTPVASPPHPKDDESASTPPQHPSIFSPDTSESTSSMPPMGRGDVCLERPAVDISFGFAFRSKNQSSTGAIISYIYPDSPAYKCTQLFVGDEMLEVNVLGVSDMKTSDILALVQQSGTYIYLTVQHQLKISAESSSSESNEGTTRESSSLSSDGKIVLHINMCRVGRSFGFTIRGGAEYNCPISILRIADGGTAQIDGRLKVDDELLEINGSNTVNMLHTDAITLIKQGGSQLNLVLEREQPEEIGWDSSRLYNEAMKAGFVTVKATNVLLFGMAGTGKTSTKHLIFGLPPPEERNSTPLAQSAERVLIRKIRDMSGIKAKITDQSWKPVTFDDLKQLVADIVHHCGRNASTPENISKELAITIKQLPVLESSAPEPHIQPTHRERENVEGTLVSDSEESMPRSEEIPTTCDTLATQAKEMSDEFLKNVADVIAKIQAMVATELHPKEIKGSNWIYFIDSGGQPHFYNLLPLFVRGVSAALYVLRLSDRLDEHPLVEYYKDDKPVDEPFRSHLSTEDNFKYLVQSIQSCNKDCRLVCVGTHLDKIEQCSETIREKNSKLLKVLPESVRDRCHFDSIREERLIIPVNSQVLGETRRVKADKIRKTIQECPYKEIQVPVWWYALEIIIEEVSNGEGCSVISLDQCRAIAKKLNFHEDALIEALKFFHTHHIFHYYPDVLPNVVFCDTQVLLDKVTELVEHAAYLRDGRNTASGLGIKYQLRDRGIVTLECLAEFRKYYVDGLFGPSELTEVFKHLLITTPLNSPSSTIEYYMPSLLGICSVDELNSLRATLLHEMNSNPLLVQFTNGWPHFGVFCCLQVFLIKDCGWSLETQTDDFKPKQNIARMYLPDSPGLVILIDSITYIEVHVNSCVPNLIYTEIRRKILQGIQYACKALHYDQEHPELAFMCPHLADDKNLATNGTPTIEVPRRDEWSCHPAVLLAGSGWMRCTQCATKCYRLKTHQKIWLAGFNSVTGPAKPLECSQIDFTKAYSTMVKCSVSLISTMSKDPLSMAATLFSVGLIPQNTLDEIVELDETKKKKGSRLYQVVLDAVKAFPVKVADFVYVLSKDKALYGDVLIELEKLFIVETLL